MADDEKRQGVVRESSKSNLLLVKAQLGKVKPIQFLAPPPLDFAFGLAKPPQPEGAREVTMSWVEHRPNPDDKPGPDFRAMNKLATISGVTTAKEERGFRTQHPQFLKTGSAELKAAMAKKAIVVPSMSNPDFVYGRPSHVRPVEELRIAGERADIQQLIQNEFMGDWVHMNEGRAEEFRLAVSKIPPRPTKATTGHAQRAHATLHPEGKAPLVLKQFAGVESRVMATRTERPGADVNRHMKVH